jgi:hypothetical protein
MTLGIGKNHGGPVFKGDNSEKLVGFVGEAKETTPGIDDLISFEDGLTILAGSPKAGNFVGKELGISSEVISPKNVEVSREIS